MVFPSGFFVSGSVLLPRAISAIGFPYPPFLSIAAPCSYLSHFFLPVVELTAQSHLMNVLSSSLLLCAIFVLSLPAQASGKKTPPSSISFHLEGSAVEAPKFAREFNTLAGAKYFRKVPEVSSKNIEACSPFPADDDLTYGIVFKLNTQGSKRLNEVTTMHQGKLLLSLVNGQPLGVVRIDKPVTDGILVIWSGVTEQEVKLYDQIAPRIGEDPKQWKARLKKLKKESKKS